MEQFPIGQLRKYTAGTAHVQKTISTKLAGVVLTLKMIN